MRLFDKGTFEPINHSFISRSIDAFQDLSRIQEEFDKPDTDTFMNEVRDSVVALRCNFTHVNTEKHGFDARRGSQISKFDYLEVKSTSFSAHTWQATFNDTNIEKADDFKMDNVYLALAVWKGAADLMFVVYGKSPLLGEFLEKKVTNFLNGNGGVRSTQTIPMAKLINDWGFKIYAVSKTPNEVCQLLFSRSLRSRISRGNVLDITDLR